LSNSLAVFQAKSLRTEGSTKLRFLMEVGAETEVSKQLYYNTYKVHDLSSSIKKRIKKRRVMPDRQDKRPCENEAPRHRESAL
jgi:hypothetical protein